jgi:hypothetical protein
MDFAVGTWVVFDSLPDKRADPGLVYNNKIDRLYLCGGSSDVKSVYGTLNNVYVHDFDEKNRWRVSGFGMPYSSISH